MSFSRRLRDCPALHGVATTYEGPERVVVGECANGRSARVNPSLSTCELQLRQKLGCTNLFASFAKISGKLLWQFSSNATNPTRTRTRPPITPDGSGRELLPHWSRSIVRSRSPAKDGGGRSSRSPDLVTWLPSDTWIRETGLPISPAERSSGTRFLP